MKSMQWVGGGGGGGGGRGSVIVIHYAIMKIHFKKANRTQKHLHKIIKHKRTALVSDVIIIAGELPRANDKQAKLPISESTSTG